MGLGWGVRGKGGRINTTNLHHLRHHLEIIDIKRRRQRIDEPGLLTRRIAECVRRPRPDDDVIALFRVEVDFFFSFSILLFLHPFLYLTNNNTPPLHILHARAVKAYGPFRNEEGLVVHLVPVRHGARSVRREGELDHAEPVVGVGAVFHDAAREGVPDVNDFAGVGGDECYGFLRGGEEGHFWWVGWFGWFVGMDGGKALACLFVCLFF